MASLIETCKLNLVNPQSYLTDVLTRLVDGWPQSRIDEQRDSGSHNSDIAHSAYRRKCHRAPPRLVLVNGDELTNLMIGHGVGIRVANTIEIKHIDNEYFEGTESE